MQNLAEQLLSRFIALREQKGEKLDIGDAAMMVSDLTDLMEQYNSKNNNNIYNEIRDISEKIKKAKEDICNTLPDGVVPEATLELDAVVKATEDATNRILDSADNIRKVLQKMSDANAVKEIEKEIVGIFEACNFQDITGQRIKKVTATLQYIENSIGSILTNFDNKKKPHPVVKKQKKLEELTDKDLMNGPQMSDKAPNQNDVDRLFDSA